MRHLFRTVFFTALFAASSAFLAQSAFAVFFCNGFPATIVGSPFGDFIVGTPFRDVIVGLGGNDDIRSLGGNDVVCGGAGNDVIRLGAGNDQGFGGPGNDTIFGQAGRDLVAGAAGNDTLRGDNGPDTVNGGPGSDDCEGGAGTNSVTNCENGPVICQSPPLNSNFSNLGVYFVDSFNAILVGLSSDGFNVVMVLSDIPFNGALVAVGGFPTSQTHCIVNVGAFDTDMDGDFSDEIVFGASGICDLPFNRTVLFLDNLSIAGVPLGFNITGECSDIQPFDVSASRAEQGSTDAMTEGLKEGVSRIQGEMIEDLRNENADADGDTGLLKDFQQNLQE
jgi:Ca2+-binding RTX toxin-like protein